jgi:hypothetical protein
LSKSTAKPGFILKRRENLSNGNGNASRTWLGPDQVAGIDSERLCELTQDP